MKKYILAFILVLSISFSQKISLVDWYMPIHEEYDTKNYQIATRISSFLQNDSLTYITISFSDESDIRVVKAELSQEGKNINFIYKSENTEPFSCPICLGIYHITYVLKGTIDSTCKFYFNGQNIIRSDETYKIFPETYRIVKGDTIDRANKYGVKVGLWIKPDYSSFDTVFFDNGKEVWQSGLYKIRENHFEVHHRYEKFVVINGDTINYTDKNGLKQGIHFINHEFVLNQYTHSNDKKKNNNIIGTIKFYRNDREVFSYQQQFNKQNKLEIENLYLTNNKYRVQYKNGIHDSLYINEKFNYVNYIKNEKVKSFKINKGNLKYGDFLRITPVTKVKNYCYDLITPNNDTLKVIDYSNFKLSKIKMAYDYSYKGISVDYKANTLTIDTKNAHILCTFYNTMKKTQEKIYLFTNEGTYKLQRIDLSNYPYRNIEEIEINYKK